MILEVLEILEILEVLENLEVLGFLRGRGLEYYKGCGAVACSAACIG